MKRFVDLTLSGVGLILAMPLMAVLAVLTKLDSPGPVLFRQVRAGRHGRDFILLKFRSMTVKPSASQGEFEAGNVSRVTRVGRILRTTKLDELPQLLNVLKGDMSLVGPRPEVRKWVEAYPGRWARVLTVRPGITDPASIAYRNEETLLAASRDPERTYREVILPRKLDMYDTYVEKQSFFGDVAILFLTIWAVIWPAGGPEAVRNNPALNDDDEIEVLDSAIH